MRLTDIFKFKLFDRTDKADLDVVNENFQNVETALNNCKQDLSNHKSSGDHDSRYYTETEVDGKLSEKSDTSHNHDGRYLQKSAVINSNTVTETGYALDARQANPNVSGSLGAQINSLNKTFTTQIDELNTNLGTKATIIDRRLSTQTYNLRLEANSMYLLTANVNINSAAMYGIMILIATTENSIKHFEIYNNCPSDMNNRPFFPASGLTQGVYPQGWYVLTSVVKLY